MSQQASPGGVHRAFSIGSGFWAARSVAGLYDLRLLSQDPHPSAMGAVGDPCVVDVGGLIGVAVLPGASPKPAGCQPIVHPSSKMRGTTAELFSPGEIDRADTSGRRSQPRYQCDIVSGVNATRVAGEAADGPVVLAGHSYGGAVITVAGAAENVVGLVFVSGYVLKEGESLGQLRGSFPNSNLAGNLVCTP